MMEEKIDWWESHTLNPSLSTSTPEQQRALVGPLGDSFVANGFRRPDDYDLRGIVSRVVRGHVLIQDTGNSKDGRANTRKPVEKLLAAIVKAQEALDECRTIGELESPPGRLNVARLLIEYGHIFDFSYMEYVVDGVLSQGIEQSKREANYVYDEFISIVWKACDPRPSDRNSFVKLLFDCEKTALPKSYRGLTKSTVGDRYDAWLKRAPARKAEYERWCREHPIPQPMTLEQFIAESAPYLEPPPPADKPGAICDTRIRSKGRRGRTSGGRRDGSIKR